MVQIVVKLLLTTFEMMAGGFHRIERFCTRCRVVERLCFAERSIFVARCCQKNDRCLLERFQKGMNIKNLFVWCSVCNVNDGISRSPRELTIFGQADRHNATYRMTELRLRGYNHAVARAQ